MNTGHDLLTSSNASTIFARVMRIVLFTNPKSCYGLETNRYLDKESLYWMERDADMNEVDRA